MTGPQTKLCPSLNIVRIYNICVTILYEMNRFTPGRHEEYQEQKCDEELGLDNSTAHWMGRCALISWIKTSIIEKTESGKMPPRERANENSRHGKDGSLLERDSRVSFPRSRRSHRNKSTVKELQERIDRTETRIRELQDGKEISTVTQQKIDRLQINKQQLQNILNSRLRNASDVRANRLSKWTGQSV